VLGGLLNPLSANRPLPVRLGVTFFCLATVMPWPCAWWSTTNGRLIVWIYSVNVLISLGL
jgi:hypothetical protein